MKLKNLLTKPKPAQKPKEQDLDLYWADNFANVLETWGEDHVWNEIQMLLSMAQGKVLDIACGTGTVIKKLEQYKNLDVHGFDISDLLIERAKKKGIDISKLTINDATASNYETDEFDYSYSIGSLEHFTEEGIDKFLSEASRYTKIASFHMIPVSKSDTNEGWLKTAQSFYNNSVQWWLSFYEKYYTEVTVINSGWKDHLSFGKWFVCKL